MGLNQHEIQEEYGDVVLSIVAGQYAYCQPRSNLPQLSDYATVEIALVHQKDGLVSPASLGLNEFIGHFEDGESPVAGYVSLETVNRVREALKQRAANTAQEHR